MIFFLKIFFADYSTTNSLFSPYGLLLQKWHIKVKSLLNHDWLLNHVRMQRKLRSNLRSTKY